jgi:hypothetical protein
MDGAKLTDSLDGKSLRVDPGSHTLRFEAPGHPPISKQLVVAAGEKNRIVLASFPAGAATQAAPPASPSASTPAPAEAPRSASPPLATWILGGVGLAALGGFAYFGLTGNALHDQLVSRCTQQEPCSQSDKDQVLLDWHLADAFLATAVVAVSVGAVLYFTRPSAPPAQVAVRALPGGGAAAGLHVAF